MCLHSLALVKIVILEKGISRNVKNGVFMEDIKIVLNPSWMFNPVEFKRSEDGKTIEGWRSLGWKSPQEYEEWKNR